MPGKKTDGDGYEIIYEIFKECSKVYGSAGRPVYGHISGSADTGRAGALSQTGERQHVMAIIDG